MEKKITDLLRALRSAARGRSTGFAIGTTVGRFAGALYTTPLRATKEIIYAGAIVRDAQTAAKVARMVDGKVQYVFLDVEKKIVDIEPRVSRALSRSKVITYKGNDLAAQAADALIARLQPA